MSDEPTCLYGPAREELNRLVKERIGWTWFEFGKRFDMSGAQGTLVSRGKRPFSLQNLAYLRRLADAMESVPLPGAMIDDGPLPSSRPPIVFGAPPPPKAVVVTEYLPPPDLQKMQIPAGDFGTHFAEERGDFDDIIGSMMILAQDEHDMASADRMNEDLDTAPVLYREDVVTALADAFIDAMADPDAGEAIQDALSTVADTLGISEQVVAQIKESLAAQAAESTENV